MTLLFVRPGMGVYGCFINGSCGDRRGETLSGAADQHQRAGSSNVSVVSSFYAGMRLYRLSVFKWWCVDLHNLGMPY